MADAHVWLAQCSLHDPTEEKNRESVDPPRAGGITPGWRYSPWPEQRPSLLSTAEGAAKLVKPPAEEGKELTITPAFNDTPIRYT